ncbi:hypothetical protein ACLKA7_002180 [Drosophila subpalustris]
MSNSRRRSSGNSGGNFRSCCFNMWQTSDGAESCASLHPSLVLWLLLLMLHSCHRTRNVMLMLIFYGHAMWLGGGESGSLLATTAATTSLNAIAGQHFISERNNDI